MNPVSNVFEMKDKALASIKVGETVVVSEVKACPPDLLRRLVAMGLVAGSKLTVTQRGLFGSPINVKLFGSILSLRSTEASLVQVHPV
jgi:Fe2+ transport system protein FeoA